MTLSQRIQTASADETTPEQIAGQLTEAQRAAMCGRWAWPSPFDADIGEAELHRLGLWKWKTKRGESHFTPLGLAVRAILEKQDADSR